MTTVKLVTIRDVAGALHVVAREDLDDARRVQVPLRCKTGRKFYDLPGNLRPSCCTIHRANIAESP